MSQDSELIKMGVRPRISKEHLGTLYAVFSGFLYGLLGYFGISIIKSDVSVYNMLFWRFLVATLFIGLLLIPTFKTFKEKPKELLKVFCFGFMFYGIGSLLYFFASLYIGTGLAMVIFFCHPAFVFLINTLFFKSQITKAYIVSIVLIILGLCFMVDLHELKIDILGIGLAIISSLFYAIYIVLSKKYKIAPLNATFVVCLGSTLSAGALALIDNSFMVPSSFYVWANIFGIAIICTAVPILFLLLALKYIRSEKVAILSVLEPICVMIFGILLLDESITYTQIIGSVIVLAAALMTIKIQSNTPKNMNDLSLDI
jgi:drug/metabolite transporter (DMT)-like permease